MTTAGNITLTPALNIITDICITNQLDLLQSTGARVTYTQVVMHMVISWIVGGLGYMLSMSQNQLL